MAKSCGPCCRLFPRCRRCQRRLCWGGRRLDAAAARTVACRCTSAWSAPAAVCGSNRRQGRSAAVAVGCYRRLGSRPAATPGLAAAVAAAAAASTAAAAATNSPAGPAAAAGTAVRGGRRACRAAAASVGVGVGVNVGVSVGAQLAVLSLILLPQLCQALRHANAQRGLGNGRDAAGEGRVTEGALSKAAKEGDKGARGWQAWGHVAPRPAPHRARLRLSSQSRLRNLSSPNPARPWAPLRPARARARARAPA
jgi:hypothetical protein